MLVADYFNEQYNYYSTIPENETPSRKKWFSKGWVLPEVSHENVNADSLSFHKFYAFLIGATLPFARQT